jgi:prepilin-type N-terminal cleavage/methylation domain-containing protein
MNNSKGFTLVEMMVAAGILTLALAGAMSFFIYQSHKGADASKIRAARENLTLALTLIQRDIMAAGYGVMGATAGSAQDPKMLMLVTKANYGVDNVTSNQYTGTSTTSRPDKLHVGYGTFLDMNFDVNGSNDASSVFKYSAIKTVGDFPGDTGDKFTYVKFPVDMDVSTDTKPVGGFICASCGTGVYPDAGDVDWASSSTTNKPPGTKNWTAKLYSGDKSSLSGYVAPSIVYRIAQDSKRPTEELQRNGVRIAGGDPSIEVYNIEVGVLIYPSDWASDPTKRNHVVRGTLSKGAGNQLLVTYQNVDSPPSYPNVTEPANRRFAVRIDYQVKVSGSEEEPTLHGTAKKTWYKGFVTLKADPRLIILSGG